MIRLILSFLAGLASAAASVSLLGYPLLPPGKMDYKYIQWLHNSAGADVILQPGRFGCPVGQRRAILTNGRGGGWTGCWLETPDSYYVLWEDGDRLTLLKSMIVNPFHPGA